MESKIQVSIEGFTTYTLKQKLLITNILLSPAPKWKIAPPSKLSPYHSSETTLEK